MLSDEITYRQATAADSDFAYAVKKAALGPYITTTFGWDEDTQLVFHADEYDPTISQIIIHHNKQIGWLATSWSDDAMFVNHIYLLPAVQGQGLGRHLMQTITDQADNNCLVARLDVLKVNPARHLYERCGFAIVGEDDHFYHMERQPHGASDPTAQQRKA